MILYDIWIDDNFYSYMEFDGWLMERSYEYLTNYDPYGKLIHTLVVL